MNARFIFADGHTLTRKILPCEENGKQIYTLTELPKGTVTAVDFCYDGATAAEGDEGYYLIPTAGYSGDSFLMRFHGHEGQSYVKGSNLLCFYGGRFADRSFYAAITGMQYEYELVAECTDGIYRIYPRFVFNSITLYEPIRVEFCWLAGSRDYSEICGAYRADLLSQGKCKPLAERCETDEKLAYAKDSVIIRIRMGWKPAPSPVPCQTRETEPPLHVATDFDRVCDLMRECKRQGIEKAEFCLVGWNVRGHDGRWPETFPIEPALGGADGLRRVLETAEELGYRVGGHTNFTDAYQIADCWDEEKIRRKRNGAIADSKSYSGGIMYDLCPLCSLQNAQERLTQIAGLGFSGLHYIDVIGVVYPRDCSHPDHKITRTQGAKAFEQIAKMSHEIVGGFTTEGGYDYVASQNDYALYLSARNFVRGEHIPEVCDEFVPLWQLIYHGIIMSTPYTLMMQNGSFEEPAVFLKNIEYGGRPLVYINQQFYKSDRPVPYSDMLCSTEEQLHDCVSKIKKLSDEFALRSHAETAFMVRHEALGNQQYKVTYSDGTVITVDYAKESYLVEKSNASV